VDDHRSLTTRRLALAALALMLPVACGGRATNNNSAPAGSGGGGAGAAGQALMQAKDVPAGLDLRLSAGKQGPPAFDRATLAPARKLSPADTTALLARAKPIAADAADPQAFALRAGSQPPPRTGVTITSAFPPPASSLLPPAASDAGGDLRVLRYLPEGKVPLAPELSVTFSQPMIAVTSQEDAAATTPVKLSPPAKGKWRWIGTRTLLFDPEVRFPQATTYKVEIPAGTKSAIGGTLKQPTRFTFETPAPAMVAHYPDGSPQRLNAPMFVMFDQRIDPRAVLSAITVKAGGKPFAIRMLEPAELAADKQLQSLVDGAKQAEQDGRWLAFRATQPFPADTAIAVELGTGTPSAEGPNRTTQPQTFGFQTYPPLKIESHGCGWGSTCTPGMSLEIVFNNPLDADQFDDSKLVITPALPDATIVQSGKLIAVAGTLAARTRYRMVVPGGVIDEFGQTLP